MSAHKVLKIQGLINAGDTRGLLEMYKSLREAGLNDAARYLLRAAHQANKTRGV